MSCIKEGLLQKYIDGEATPKEVSNVMKHVTVCKTCAERIAAQKKLAEKIKNAINLISDENVEASSFVNPVIKINNKLINKIRLIILSASAASILIFALIFNDWNKTNERKQVLLINEIEHEIDANRTASQQNLTIRIVDPEGNISEFQIN